MDVLLDRVPYVIACDALWTEEVKALVSAGIATPTGDGHVSLASRGLLQGWRSGASGWTRDGRLRRNILAAMLREEAATGQIRVTLGVTEHFNRARQRAGDADPS